MTVGPREVLHFSEDSTITEFVPHVAATAERRIPYVWAVDENRAPDYWFPRQCPRAMAWVTEGSTERDRERLLGPGSHPRVHTVEYGWLDRIRSCRLFVYRLPGATFRLADGEVPHAYVSEQTVSPLAAPVPVGDLLVLHERAGIQLRLVDNIWPWWDAVVGSTLGHSGIRLANAEVRAVSASTSQSISLVDELLADRLREAERE